MQIILANPRGFCAGVERAIAIVERAIEKFGAPIYVRHEVVHNKFVCDDLRSKGAIFVEDLNEVPTGNTVIFSAHGVPKAVRDDAEARGLRVFDATCPLVTKVHHEVARNREEGREIIMVGHKGHPEVEGTMGQSSEGMYLVETADDVETLHVRDSQKLAYVTQTTLSIDDAEKVVSALRDRFPLIVGPKRDDICYATQNRQDAVKKLTKRTDVIFVVGSKSSSNSNRLREVAERAGTLSFLLEGPDFIDQNSISKDSCVGVTAGASAPEILVEQVIARLIQLGAGSVETLECPPENITFALPKELSLPSHAAIKKNP